MEDKQTKQDSSNKSISKMVSSNGRPLIVVLDNIRSRENVGSIFRTADAAGVDMILLCGITPCPPHEKISKTALGAEDSVPWEYRKTTWRVLQQFQKNGDEVLLLEQTPKSKNIFDYVTEEKFFKQSILESLKNNFLDIKKRSKNDRRITPNEVVLKADPSSKGSHSADQNFGGPKARILVIGNEVSGISKKLLNYATDAVEIPMKGIKESLNVAVAFGIAIYALKAK